MNHAFDQLSQKHDLQNSKFNPWLLEIFILLDGSEQFTSQSSPFPKFSSILRILIH